MNQFEYATQIHITTQSYFVMLNNASKYEVEVFAESTFDLASFQVNP